MYSKQCTIQKNVRSCKEKTDVYFEFGYSDLETVTVAIAEVLRCGKVSNYKSLLAFSYLDKVKPIPMGNFSPQYRLRRKCNLIFMTNDDNNK